MRFASRVSREPQEIWNTQAVGVMTISRPPNPDIEQPPDDRPIPLPPDQEHGPPIETPPDSPNSPENQPDPPPIDEPNPDEPTRLI